MLTIIAFLVLISIVVSVHEYGHYLAARYCGVKVLVFSIGFGKPLLACRFRGAIWQICMIPLGGYVKMLSQSDPDEAGKYPPEQTLEMQPAHKKILIDLAGPLANMLFTVLIFMLIFMQGVNVLRPVLGQVAPGSIADRAGLQSHMQVLRVNDRPVESWDELRTEFSKVLAEKSSVTLTVLKPNEAEFERVLDLSGVATDTVDMKFFAELGMSALPLSTRIDRILDNSPAKEAGLTVGDRIVAVDGEPVTQWSHLWQKIRQSPHQSLQLNIIRQDKHQTITITPQAIEEKGQTYGMIGVVPEVDEGLLKSWISKKSYPMVDSIVMAAERSWTLAKTMVQQVGKMIVGKAELNQLGGPVYIAQVAGSSAQAGWQTFAGTLALISMSLGILNLLPIPILDGGRLLYHSVEWVRGKPLPDTVYIFGQKVSVVIIFLIMMLALFNDLSRL